MKYLFVLAFALALASCQTTKDAANVAPLEVQFDWTLQDKCNGTSPAFIVRGIPAGTASLSFRMTDLDVPSYDHGGGTVANDGSGKVARGAFTYVGPCPPSGSHRYQFAVTALNASGDTILGRGTAMRVFPPK